MVKSIQELHDKIEKREDKRLDAGKEFTTSHSFLVGKLRNINNNSSDVYRHYMLSEKEFCSGFLYGMLCSHYISEGEFKILYDEITSAYDAYRERAREERQERKESLKSTENSVAV